MSKAGRVALFLICLLLTAGVFGYIGWRMYSIQQEADAVRVEREAQAQAEAAAAAAAEAEAAAKAEAEAKAAEEAARKEAEARAAEEAAKAKEEAEKKAAEEKAEPTEAPKRDNIISIRGDSMIIEGEEGAEITEEGYPAKLQKLLDADGKDFVVEDYTWFMAGTLSQMRLAGVPEDVVQGYIDSHKAIAENAGVEAGIYETVIRDDLDAKLKEKERDDQMGIPVIFMGYNGGWNADPYELIEQQHRMLDTYEQKDKYIIMGLYPSYFTADDIAYYDTIFTDEWGDHFISLSGKLEYDPLSDEARQQIADILYERLTAVGYLEGGQAQEGQAEEGEAQEEAPAEGAEQEETGEGAAEENTGCLSWLLPL